MKPHILYHADCLDGFGAAFAAWKKLGDDAVYHAVTHGDPPPDLPEGASVYILDFSYYRDIILKMAQKHSIQIVDHHKSAQEDLAGLDFACFNMKKSGAVLSWEFFHPGQEIPELLLYIQDKDLWLFSLPDSDAVSVALSIHDNEFHTWDTLTVSQLKQEGQLLLRYRGALLQQLSQQAHWIELAGYDVPAVNTSIFTSEIGNYLCQKYPEAKFAACYSYLSKERQKWSLRSIGAFDVSQIAQKFGGGGHVNAAGFNVFSG